MPTNIVPIQAQRRLAEVGRIRLGKKVPISNGKSRPAKLDKFRLTSRDKARLDAAAELYGGTVEAWDGQWELYTDADIIPIAVVPHQALNVSYELWGQKTIGGQKTPVICLRRCDGEFEAKSDGPCLCAQQEEMTCRPTARLSVVLTDVPGLGVWRLESHGWNALTELQGTVELLEALVSVGRPVRARLRLDKRESPNEKGTRKFVVPVIDIDHTLGQVLDAIGQGMSPEAIEVGAAGELERRNNMTPVPALQAASQPTVAEQVETAAERERAPRANAAEPIRGTGVQPRTVAELSGTAHAHAPDGDGAATGSVSPAPPDPVPSPASGEGNRPSEAQVPPPDDEGPSMPLPQRVAMWIGELDPGTLTADDFRHEFLAAFSEGAYNSAKNFPSDGQSIANLRAAIARYKQGHLELRTGGNNGTRFVSAVTGLPDDDPAGQSPARRGGPFVPDDTADTSTADPSLDLWDADRWLAEIAPITGVGQATLLKAARNIAGDLGVDVPNTVGEITDPTLVAAVLKWLGEKAAA